MVKNFEQLVGWSDLQTEVHDGSFVNSFLVRPVLHSSGLDLRRHAVAVVLLDDAPTRFSAAAIEVSVSASQFPRHEILCLCYRKWCPGFSAGNHRVTSQIVGTFSPDDHSLSKSSVVALTPAELSGAGCRLRRPRRNASEMSCQVCRRLPNFSAANWSK